MKIIILFVIAALCIIALFIYGPIPQPLSYHQFSDQRALWGIPNYQNVLSNFLILGVGAWGFLFVNNYKKRLFTFSIERFLWLLFFINIIFVAVFSSYYHLDPNNERLAFDRLPMAIATMSFVSIIIAERLGEKAATIMTPILLVIGVWSVAYWILTEMQYAGDVRAYVFVQFYAIVAIILICGMYPRRYSGANFLYIAIGWYVISKVCEYYDSQIFYMTHNEVSGHVLKHIFTAFAIGYLIFYLKVRLLQRAKSS